MMFCAVCATPDNSMRNHRIFGESLQNYYQELFEENFRKYESRIAGAQTRADALKIVADARNVRRKSERIPIEIYGGTFSENAGVYILTASTAFYDGSDWIPEFVKLQNGFG